MAENLLAIIAEKPIQEALKRLRDEYFKKTGDGSVYALPPCLLLGKTDKTTFQRKIYHLALSFPRETTETDDGVFIALPLDEIQKALNLSVKVSGVYLGKEKCDLNIEIPPSKTQRLVMLVKRADGYRLLQ